MISCPECGLEAPDGAKFCDRCGRGLAAGPAPAAGPSLRPAPLSVGTMLKGNYEIAELIGQDSVENRYRAVRRSGAKTEQFRLRERSAPNAVSARADGQAAGVAETPRGPAGEENPAGPQAKTQELKPVPASSAEPAGPASDGGLIASGTAEASPHETSAAEACEAVPPGPNLQADAAPPASEPSEAGALPVGAAITNSTVEQGEAGGASAAVSDDLGDVFGRVLALSLTLDHPALERALEGFACDGRVYLVYPENVLVPLSRRPGGIRMCEPEAIATAVQVCQAVSFIHRRGLRLNDLCPESIAAAPDGRIRIAGLDYVSNDDELQAEPVLNPGFTAPEIYRGRKADKRADLFSIGALLYAMLTGERLESESWREEAGAVRFYPPHAVSPVLEQAVRRAVLFDAQQRWPSVDALKAELLRLNAGVKIRSAAMTDVGRVRELNEDAVLALEYFRDSQVEPAQSFLYAVCDGMGGAEAGEMASALAVDVLRDYFKKGLDRGGMEGVQELGKLLATALEEANLNIIEYQRQHPEARGMGSTGVCAMLAPPDGAVAWVGDSRAYLLEGGVLRQITKDHSLVQRLVEIGQITPEEARHHEHRNVITRSLGARQSGAAGAEAVSFRVRRGGRFLLCSDGLTTHVEDQDIAEIIRRHEEPYGAARELIAAANAGGGTDNISVVVVFAS